MQDKTNEVSNSTNPTKPQRSVGEVVWDTIATFTITEEYFDELYDWMCLQEHTHGFKLLSDTVESKDSNLIWQEHYFGFTGSDHYEFAMCIIKNKDNLPDHELKIKNLGALKCSKPFYSEVNRVCFEGELLDLINKVLTYLPVEVEDEIPCIN